MSLVNGLAALSTSMEQAELRMQLGMKLMRKTLDIQKTTGENTVQLLHGANVRQQAVTPKTTGKGDVIDVYS